MKKYICIAAMCASSLALRAEPITMHAPFEFVVSGKTLPAGDYRVQPLASGVLLIAGDAGNSVLALVTMGGPSFNDAARAVGGAATFDNRGPEPVLTSIATRTATWHLMPPDRTQAAVSLRSKK